MDPSLKPDPNRKGSYYRRIEDVMRGLDRLQHKKLPETIRFFTYYFGCEKIARGLIGINARLPATKAYSGKQNLKLGELKKAVAEFNLQISDHDVEWLFADYDEQRLLISPSPIWTSSARHLRNKLVHDFGPSNVNRITEHAPFHNPKMELFLDCVPNILKYQRLHFADVE